MEELKDYFVEVLRQCIDAGMALPFTVCAVGSNSNLIAVRINDGRGPDSLAQHSEGEGFQMPVNIMVVDRHGEAARVVIGCEGITTYQ